MELRHLRYFVAVAEELNFRRAAERLHLAQPALSAQVKNLEDELGVKLFQRTTRSVLLTQGGKLFLDDARVVLAAAVQAEQRARRAGAGLAGTLRVGMIAPIANAWLAGKLRPFRQKFPGVQLSLFDLTSTEQLRRLRTGELDAGLLRPPVGFPELAHELVEESWQVLAFPAGHRLAKVRKLKWKDFDGEGLVMMHPGVQHGYYDAFLAACAKDGAKPFPAQYANDVQTKMWLISAGFGIAPTTATLRKVKRPGLLFRPLPPGLPRVQTVLTWRRDDDSPVLKKFIEHFRTPRLASGLTG
jgi:DNA-binding transcriptional LysR family regulator